MSYVYPRGSRLYVGYLDPELGRVVQRSTGLLVGQEKDAKKLLAKIEARLAAHVDFRTAAGGDSCSGPITTSDFALQWLKGRERDGIASIKDEANHLNKHVLPQLGTMALDAVRPRDIRGIVKELRRGTLAPKTVRNIYGTLHVMFEDAVADELIERSPCALRKNDLPKNEDNDPEWRAGAVFTREEVEQLISDPRIPERRRVLYAVLFLAGPRFGEAAVLRVRHYDRRREPLGGIQIAWQWHTKSRKEARTKTRSSREVPVHPLLAKILGQWLLTGWRSTFGRPPRPDDLLIPYLPRSGPVNTTTPWRSDTCRKRFREDCELLGLRPRRVHDARRTFITLARADGARDDLLKWITHGRQRGIMNDYMTPPWEILCDQVVTLKLAVMSGEVVSISGRKGIVAGGL